MTNEIAKENKFKRFIKKHKVALIVWASVLILVGLIGGRFVYLMTSSIIPDKNGTKDFSVVTFSNEDIKNAVESNYGGFGNGQFYDGNSTDISGSLSDVDYDMTRYTSLSMNGILIANATKTQSENMSLIITSTVESGNTQIFVFIDDELYKEVGINGTEELSLNGISEKTVYVKAACESAKMSIEVKRTINEKD